MKTRMRDSWCHSSGSGSGDWAQKLVAELQRRHLVTDDATRAFCEAYKDGDSIEANEKYSLMAEREEIINGYVVRVFADGSCDADWQQGIDRFYPDLNDLIADDDDVAKLFAA